MTILAKHRSELLGALTVLGATMALIELRVCKHSVLRLPLSFMMNILDDESYLVSPMQTLALQPFMHF
jgi:hypothetical protein